jgi:hypothetical protein
MPKTTKRIQPLTQRKAWQAWSHMDKAREAAFLARDEAKNKKRLDDVQDLTEIIFSLSQAQARYRHLCKRRFGKEPELLAIYK